MATPATAKAPIVYEKIVTIMKEIGPVEKTGYNSFHKYKYLKEEDIINAVRPLLAKHGVALVPQVLEENVTFVRNAKGGEETLCRLKVEFTFVDTATGDGFSVTTVGHGIDPGDKAAYKALTGALKYCLRQLFMISEGGEDPEADEGTDERRIVSRSTPDNYGMDASQASDRTISITPSDVKAVRAGGRTDQPTKAQIDALRNIVLRNQLSNYDVANLIVAINGDSVGELSDDPVVARMAIQNYLDNTTGKKVAALIEGIQAAMQEPGNGDEPPPF